jgi:hypothetical protein
MASGSLDGRVVAFTTLDRITRSEGKLQELIDEAQPRGIRLVALLQPSEALEALQPGGYTANALGSELHSEISSSEEGRQLLAAVDQWAATQHRLVQTAAHNTPVVLPVVLTHCSAAALAAFKRLEQQAAGFAGGRQASFSNALDSRGHAAQEAGVHEYVRLAPAALRGSGSGGRGRGGERGVGEQHEAAMLRACRATLSTQLGGEPAGLSISLARFAKSSRAWVCRSCSCGAGGPDPHCRCRCFKCRLVREAACTCPAACDKGGTCSCVPGCSCSCRGCHRGVSGSGSEAAAGSSSNSSSRRGGPHPCWLCAAPVSRPSQLYCSDHCYLQACEAEQAEPRRCKHASACMAPVPPALAPPGCVHGASCLNCHNAGRWEKVAQAKPAAAEEACPPATAAGPPAAAAAGPAAAPAAGGSGATKRKSPRPENSSVGCR